MADEAADISNVEQMSLVWRFVDRDSNIREEFLGFVPCSEGLSGEAISKTILAAVTDLGLDIELCRDRAMMGPETWLENVPELEFGYKELILKQCMSTVAHTS